MFSGAGEGRVAGKIFINYRRGDDPGFARSLFDRLKDVFGEDRLFMDLDTLGATNDFAAVLDGEIRSGDVLLVMIGKNWLCAADDKGRRLGRAGDFVTWEIALALQLGKLVMPILVNGVPPLKEDDLPPVLYPLVPCNAFPLENEHFEGDVQKIVRTIAKHFGWSDADVARALLHGSQLHQGKPLEIWLVKWKYIESSSNDADFVEFLKSGPPQDLAQLAAKSLKRLNWQHLGANPNIETLEWFLQNHPSGEYASQAWQKAQQLRTEDEYLNTCSRWLNNCKSRDEILAFPEGIPEKQVALKYAYEERLLAIGSKWLKKCKSTREIKAFLKRIPEGQQALQEICKERLRYLNDLQQDAAGHVIGGAFLGAIIGLVIPVVRHLYQFSDLLTYAIIMCIFMLTVALNKEAKKTIHSNICICMCCHELHSFIRDIAFTVPLG
jgi:hypothetical protein